MEYIWTCNYVELYYASIYITGNGRKIILYYIKPNMRNIHLKLIINWFEIYIGA